MSLPPPDRQLVLPDSLGRLNRSVALIGIFPTSENDGKRAATIWPVSFKNWWSKATRDRMRVCVTTFSVGFHRNGRRLWMAPLRHPLWLLHGRHPSCFFVSLTN